MVFGTGGRNRDHDGTKSDEDFHHLAVCFLLAEWGRRGARRLGVDLDRKPPFQGAAVEHRHICANTG